MNKNNKIEKYEYLEFMDTLFSGLGSSDGQSFEVVKRELVEEGIDLTSILKRLKNNVQQHSQSANIQRLNLARENRLNAMTECHSIASSISNWGRERITQEIEKLSNLLGSELSVSYRDLSKSTTEDLKTLLLDLELAVSPKNQDDK